jgi:putative heme-binding domain-containing protein
MEGGNLTREEVVPFLKDADPAVQQTVLDIIGTRPAWAGGAVEYLGGELAQNDLPEARGEALRRALLALCPTRPVQEVMARALHDDRTPAANRLLLLEVMAQAPLEPLPAAWVRELGRCLDDRENRVVRQAIVTLRGRGRKDFDDRLRRLATDASRPAEIRVAAAAAAAPRLTQVEAPLFAFLLAQLDPKHPPLARLAAAEALGQARLSDAQLGELARAVAGAGALELPHLVAAFEKSHAAAVGKQLVEALEKSPGLGSLSPEGLRRTLQEYPGEVRAAAGPLFKRLEVDAEKQRARLAELGSVLSGGNAVRGRTVFFGAKATCSACHTVKSQGGKIGPDLTKIGSIRTGRDLLEAVVFPSASIVRGFEPYQVTTHDGRVHSGILGRETAEAIYLVTAERAEVRIPRRSIESFEPSRVSIMPQGLDGQLSREELADLLAFLQSLR